jgi:hypothetical protein
VTSVAGRTGAVTIAAADVSGLGSLATQSSVAYSSLTGTPSTFAPAAHNQAWSTITATPTSLSGYGITDAVGSSDARLTDSRTPTDASVTTAKIADGAVTLVKTTGVQKTITSGTAAPSGGSDGDIYVQYV